ncbi:putative PEP-binding protein [Calothrix sp. NIES-3974]|uniref:putative PEP-binding protein n=1 Tax=Calothrix sp. NIES-3974 TaxID=2005462 RepID=UPI000B5F148E|nr:putative PEP-binding protein [Calothrix sp. NIES-3974]BAZ04267.1 PEP-utilizing enzyme [Calothrix sp. NIES-3974]
MDKLYWLELIPENLHGDRSDFDYRQIVGEQILHLAQFQQQGYPILPSFVIGADVWQEFFQGLFSSEEVFTDLPHVLSRLNLNDWRELQQWANLVGDRILHQNIPNPWLELIFQGVQQWQCRCVSLRPVFILPSDIQLPEYMTSLLAMDSCVCDLDAIANALKRVWCRVWSATSLVYWQSLGINIGQIQVAILVQPLNDIVKSGSLIANSQVWEVRATWGLGLAIARGHVIPDIDKINPLQGRVIERKLGHKTVADWVVTDTNKLEEYQTRAITPLNPQTCIATCILTDEQQQQFALSPQNLEQLTVLAERVRTDMWGKISPPQDFFPHFHLEWIVLATAEGERLLLTNVMIPPQRNQSDIYHISGLGAASGRATGTAYVISNLNSHVQSIPSGSILVAPSIAAEWLPLLTNSVGIITEQGGLTSHAAILARELRIPAVVRVKGATVQINTGDHLLIDGDKGEVFCNMMIGGEGEDFDLSHEHLNFEDDITDAQASNLDVTQSIDVMRNSTPYYLSLPPIATQLFVNLSQIQSLEGIQSHPIDGVGLLRSELMGIPLLEGRSLEDWLGQSRRQTKLRERWSEYICRFAKALAPKPIFYRTYDGRYLHRQTPTPTEINLSDPHLDHGTLNYIRNPELLEFELNALGEVFKAGYTNLNLILPFVRNVEEFVYCRNQVIAAGLKQNPEFQLWIMAEVPSVLFLLPEYVRAGVQGIAIGTNDLTRLLFAIDRDTSIPGLDGHHSAVRKAIQQLINAAKTAGIPCSICGYAVSQYPEMIEDVIRWGITAISVEPSAIATTYHAIARAEHRLILAAAREKI